MQEITATQIEQAVCEVLLTAHFQIDPAISRVVGEAAQKETGALPQNVLSQIAENYQIASEQSIPICQDSGMTLIYAEVGQDVHIAGDFESAIQSGVRRAHKQGYLRTSVVCDPLFNRTNTGDGTPAIINVRLTPGECLKFTAVAKGFGSENNSTLRMFIPTTPLDEIKRFIVDNTVSVAAKSCAPIIVGVGIGGTMDKAAALAKQASFRSVDIRNPQPEYAALERELLDRINASGVGPAGLGGYTTALAVNIETFATHIASVPVAINPCCHADRHATITILP